MKKLFIYTLVISYLFSNENFNLLNLMINDDSWKFELDEFINAIKGISKIEHGTIKDAIEIMKLIDKIYDNKK